jgi:hypothetical protein
MNPSFAPPVAVPFCVDVEAGRGGEDEVSVVERRVGEKRRDDG